MCHMTVSHIWGLLAFLARERFARSRREADLRRSRPCHAAASESTGEKNATVGLCSRHFKPAAIDGEDFKARDGEPTGARSHAFSKHHHQLEHETGRPGPQHLHEGLIRPGGLLGGSVRGPTFLTP